MRSCRLLLLKDKVATEISEVRDLNTEEHSKQVWDIITEKHRCGGLHKTISKRRCTYLSAVHQTGGKKHETTATLPRSGLPSKLIHRTRKTLFAEATVTELQKLLAEIEHDV